MTTHGPISVLVCGDQAKPALVTYPDVGLNCKFVAVLHALLHELYQGLQNLSCGMSAYF